MKNDPTSPVTPGLGVDVHGNPVIDPTENVIALTNAANRRQDDLRESAKEISDSKIAHLKEIGDLRERYQENISKLREDHQAKISAAESGRIDSIRQVDREEVAKTAMAANTAIATLAKQTTDLATTLQRQVSDTATAAEARSSAQYNDTQKRLQAVELALSEGKGKQTVSDPQLVRLSDLVEQMARTQATGAGKSEGSSTMWGYIIGAIGLIGMLVGIGATLLRK